MNDRASRRLKANGISTKAFRKRSEGPRRARLPLYDLSLSYSSGVGAILSKVEINSSGSSLPDTKLTLRLDSQLIAINVNKFVYQNPSQN